MKSKQLFNGIRYFTNNYVLPIAVLLLVIVSCNNLPNEQKQPELKPSNFKAPIVDTIAVAVDSNAYIINSKLGMNSPQHNDCPINNKRILATCKHNPVLNEKSITVDFDECNRNWEMYVGDYAVFGTDKCDFLFRLRIKSIK